MIDMSNKYMRLMIEAKGQYFYDIGLRKDHKKLNRYIRRFGELQPRFLEDFIKMYGKGNIKIISYGKLDNEREYIDSLLE